MPVSNPVWHYRDFRLLVAGRSVSLLGNGLATIAIAFAVLDLTGSASDLGLVLAARSIPQVLLLLFGGVFADRLPRHHVLVAANVVSGATQALAAALLLSGDATIAALVAIEALNGAASAFIFPPVPGLWPRRFRRKSYSRRTSYCVSPPRAPWSPVPPSAGSSSRLSVPAGGWPWMR